MSKIVGHGYLGNYRKIVLKIFATSDQKGPDPLINKEKIFREDSYLDYSS